MTRFNKAILLVAASTSLAGCQLFHGGKSHMARLERGDANAVATLDEGRAFLRQGQLASAIASFKIAELDLATRADASNGLAVVYAKLGRPDLAKRYFMFAMSMEPQNMMYAANLMRLQHNIELASNDKAAPAMPAQEASPPVEQTASAPTRLVKVAQGMVYLRLNGPPQAAPHMTVVALNEEAGKSEAAKPEVAKTVAVASNDVPSTSKTVYLAATQ